MKIKNTNFPKGGVVVVATMFEVLAWVAKMYLEPNYKMSSLKHICHQSDYSE